MTKVLQAVLIVALFLLSVVVAVEPGTREARAVEPEVVDTCRGCHTGVRDLGSWSVEELDRALKAIAAGKIQHVLPLPPLSDEERRELAEALAGS
jgi:hypothetical protein